VCAGKTAKARGYEGLDRVQETLGGAYTNVKDTLSSSAPAGK
jgi:hypothetical protein